MILLLSSLKVMSQDLEALLESETEERTEVATGTFKATRLLNGHSIERMQVGQLDFRVDHRFGPFSSGSYEAFGLDKSFVHLTLDYGITDWFMIGIGRSAYQKTVDGFMKFSVLRQSSGKKNIPVSVSYFISSDIKGTKATTALDSIFINRLSYTHQILIARKMNESLSLQVMPSFGHKNLVQHPDDKNNYYACGIGGRFKLSSRVSFNMEYYGVFGKKNMSNFTGKLYNPLSIGFDLETGGHVFQLFLTNSTWNTERGSLTETTGSWLKGDIQLGFKISRVFPLVKKKVAATETAE